MTEKNISLTEEEKDKIYAVINFLMLRRKLNEISRDLDKLYRVPTDEELKACNEYYKVLRENYIKVTEHFKESKDGINS